NRVATDIGEKTISSNGFDNSGLDILSGGTLEKNISFLLVPSSDETGAFHFESVNVRFDNLFHSPWLNVKVGKFELDSFISEKRTVTLSASGGPYQLFHFIPSMTSTFSASWETTNSAPNGWATRSTTVHGCRQPSLVQPMETWTCPTDRTPTPHSSPAAKLLAQENSAWSASADTRWWVSPQLPT